MELRQLRHFLAVCEHGNYAKAALALGTSQSSVTKSVLKLEAALGARLFERGRFGATITAFGEVLAVRSRAMCSEERLATQEIEALKGGSAGTINLGVGPTFSYRLLPETIARFNHRLPDVGVVVTEGISANLFERLLKGGLDLVVSLPSIDFVPDSDLTTTPLVVDFDYHDYIVVGTDHPLANRDTITVAELADFPWVVARSADYVLARVDNLFENAGFPPPVCAVRTDSPAMIKSILRAGRHIGVLGFEVFRMEADHGLLKVLPVTGFDWPRRALLTRRRRSMPSPPVAEFVRELMTTAARGLPKATDIPERD